MGRYLIMLRKVFTNIKSILIDISTILFEFLSNIEVEMVKPNSKLFFRIIYLKLKKVRFGKNVFIAKNSIIYCGQNLVIGDNVLIGENAKIHCHGKITIGDNFLSAPGLTINSGSHDIYTMKPIVQEVEIGKNVWCGVNVTILSGVKIGDNTVIGACSLVNKDVPSYSLYGGVPAKKIKEIEIIENNVKWKWYEK